MRLTTFFEVSGPPNKRDNIKISVDITGCMPYMRMNVKLCNAGTIHTNP